MYVFYFFYFVLHKTTDKYIYKKIQSFKAINDYNKEISELKQKRDELLEIQKQKTNEFNQIIINAQKTTDELLLKQKNDIQYLNDSINKQKECLKEL